MIGWQKPGFGPVGDFPFTAYTCFPSALKRNGIGIPAGRNQSHHWIAAAPQIHHRDVVGIAVGHVQVLPSGVRATLLVLLPVYLARELGSSPAGAPTGNSRTSVIRTGIDHGHRIRLILRRIQQRLAGFIVILFGWPFTLMRFTSLGVAADKLTTSISRSRMLETYAVSLPLIAPRTDTRRPALPIAPDRSCPAANPIRPSSPSRPCPWSGC